MITLTRKPPCSVEVRLYALPLVWNVLEARHVVRQRKDVEAELYATRRLSRIGRSIRQRKGVEAELYATRQHPGCRGMAWEVHAQGNRQRGERGLRGCWCGG